MDIVIPYQKTIHGELELKYALRSIEKHLKGYNDIWIIGEQTSFKVKHIHCPNILGRKEYSICNKILTACDTPEISENFIMWHDDHFLLKDLFTHDLEYYYSGTLKELYDRSVGLYKQVVKNTIDAGTVYNFDIHTPITFNKTYFKSRMKMVDWSKEYCMKSIYCWNSKGIEMQDLKLNAPYTDNRLREKIEGRLFFSTGPYSMQPEMINLLNELYPNPSSYETNRENP